MKRTDTPVTASKRHSGPMSRPLPDQHLLLRQFSRPSAQEPWALPDEACPYADTSASPGPAACSGLLRVVVPEEHSTLV
ncbi:hypothetical protein EYF80_051376 [Liparis tanakae]|uniref:Uncharacterized protein n=1 Tax=Liparis tanakae TaxID=230148 RepID=A0A4Z2FC08_9TELE|nr:hypothetical protein EYF80_051376 [Liparis tanakae]